MEASASPSPASLAADTFATTQRLVSSLLRHWPHGPHVSSPSLLVCGPSGNGKTHLIGQCAAAAAAAAAREAAAATSGPTSGGHVALSVVTAAPSLAPALTARRQDGSTGLRQVLRDAVVKAVAASMKDDVTAATKPSQRPARAFAALVVLDRLEFFTAAGNDGGGGFSGTGENRDDMGKNSDDNGVGPSARHPAFVADLYTTLKSAPPLFTAAEAAGLSLARVVFVSVFSGEADLMHPLLTANAFDQVIALPTPGQAAREQFFRQQIVEPQLQQQQEASTSDSLGPRRGASSCRYLACLASALGLRSGGVSYRGLTEIVTCVLNDMDNGEVPLLHSDDGGGGADAAAMAASAAAHRLVSRFQASGSVAALDHRSSAGYVDVQRTRWADIAGMAATKRELQAAVARPLRLMGYYKAARVQPSTGVLLYGPPGTGKTMLAKAIATELNASFVYLDLPSLVQCEVGESERRLKAFFAVARERSPTVMFMDELQAAFGVRYGGSGAGGGRGGSVHHRHGNSTSTDSAPQPPSSSSHDARLVSQLLQLLDAAQADEAHIILFVGATNVPALLDPLILRAGRLDTHIEVGLPAEDARRSLAVNVIVGDWAAWWRPARTGSQDNGSATTPVTASSTTTSAPLDGAELAALHAALVDAFVGRSEGLSGAELRNATSVFAMRLMQAVAALSENGNGTAASSSPSSPLAAMEAQWSANIARLLWQPHGGGGDAGSLSGTALRLIDAAFSHGRAP